MSVFVRVRPSARGAAKALPIGRSRRSSAVHAAAARWPPLLGHPGIPVRIGFRRLVLASALVGLALPCIAAASPAPSEPIAAPKGPGVLTLYSEPGMRGRHATYKRGSIEVERQGFMARSAASTGLWTLCEGGEVASRCQTVDGQAPDLKLAPQIVRPGLNALALYDQPGLKGRRVIYSFPADRPAPFHARSARTWGGDWSLCERGFRHCQTLGGRMANLDLVVAAVRPEAETSDEPLPAPQPPAPVASHRAHFPDKTPSAVPISVKPDAKVRTAHSEATRSRASERAPRPPRLVRVDTPAPRTHRSDPVRSVHLVKARSAHRPTPRPATLKVRDTHTRPIRAAHRGIVIEFIDAFRPHRSEIERRWRPAHPVRDEVISRHWPRPRMVHHVAQRHVRSAHAARRAGYRRVHMMWGGPDPYLYDVDPRAWGPPPGW